MFDPQMMLLVTFLGGVAAKLDAGEDAWAEARALLETAQEDEPELSAAIESRDLAGLQAIRAGWASGERLLTVHDRNVLKRAMKAYRKSLKVTKLDAESSLGGGPFSGGRESSIAGIRPPERYPREVWDELVRQERLLDVGHGMYELGPKA